MIGAAAGDARTVEVTFPSDYGSAEVAGKTARFEVTVNAVAPGPTDTALFRHGKSDDQINAMAQAAALQRLGLPEDIADVVVFLATPAARWISGQCLPVNGGFA